MTPSSKQFWKIVKLHNKNQVSIPKLSNDNVHADTDREKAEMLNTFFAKCWNDSEPPLSEQTYDDSLNEFDIDDLLCTPDEIIHLINGLDASKSTGPDEISVRMLKPVANSIAPSLADLFNLSISKGCFPKIWKSARVVPVPKSSANKFSPSGYRPISLLSIVSKMLEKHLYFLLNDHLWEVHPLSDSQWGFQEGKSTSAAVLSVCHDWYAHLESGREISCVFFDFKKAFDTVSHRMLINKLEHLNLHPLILNWISSYLSLRNQCVVVNGASSDFVQVISGVPQGSVLGPLLFSIYIDSVTSLNLSSNLVLYADDILLYMPIVNDTDCAALQSDIDKILNWTTANLMSFNSSKCKHMIISRKSLIMLLLLFLVVKYWN